MNTYTIINTLDGQIKIPEDALPGLNEWSERIGMLIKYKSEITPTFNVPSSYLIKLISISRASAQYYSLTGELQEKKREQIVSMYNAHNREEFTRFYDEEIEITSKLAEFIETIDSIIKWNISSDILYKLIGRIVDPMDPNFTIPQYVTIASLSYLEHLKKTNPDSVDGLTLLPTLLKETDQYTNDLQIPITSWVPLNIIIGTTLIELSIIRKDKSIVFYTLNDLDEQIEELLSHKDPNSKEFKFIYCLSHKLIMNCIHPSLRVWS
jgi:hypothetical protein